MGFQDISGHIRQIEIITRALKSGTLPHAYLFVGEDGIGKKLVAKKLAQALQCGAADEKPCSACENCRKVESCNHPDVIYIEPDGPLIKADQIRALQKRLGYKPFEGGSTISIINGADKLNISAANSLLKTLEEPPASTHLILLAENTRRVLPTIISRCQRLRFNPLSRDEIEHVLIRHGLSREEASSLSGVSEGSPGKAFRFMELFPPTERENFLASATNIGGVGDVFLLAEKMTGKENADRLTEYLEVLKTFFRDVILYKLGDCPDMIINTNHLKKIEYKSKKHTLKELIMIIETISKTETALAMNANKRLAVENMLLKTFKQRVIPWQ